MSKKEEGKKRINKKIWGLCRLPGHIFVLCTYGKERSKILKIYNWADYIDEDILDEFPVWYKEQTGEDIRIIYQVFDINEIMLTKVERGHEDFDLICPFGIYHRTYAEEKAVASHRP